MDNRTGLSYPLELDNYGAIQLVSDYGDRVTQAILSALQTRLEERVWWPEYGLDDQEFRTAYPLPRQLGVIRDCLDFALQDFPDVSYSLKGLLDDTGTIQVLVSYQVPEYDLSTLEILL